MPRKRTVNVPDVGRLELGPRTADALKQWRISEKLTQVQCGKIAGLAIYKLKSKQTWICRHWQAMESGERPIPEYVSILCEYVSKYGYPPK